MLFASVDASFIVFASTLMTKNVSNTVNPIFEFHQSTTTYLSVSDFTSYKWM